MKRYIQSSTIALMMGGVVSGVLYLVFQIPMKSEQAPAPPSNVVRPLKERQMPVPAQLTSPVFQSERVAQEPETESPKEIPNEETPETNDFDIHPNSPEENILEAPDSLPDERSEKPVDGDWESRGARLKRGRKLTFHASLLMQKGRYSDASIVLRDAIQSFPAGTKDLTYGEALYKLGICLRRKGEPQEAIPVLRLAMQFPYYRTKVLREVEAATVQLRR